MKRHDYLPFGEELFAGQGLRTIGLGYSGDNIRQKFTLYERDDETGLDFAQARYYASSQGRFTSVDPLPASASADNPQTFNRYTYALNSPQTLTDPSGMLPVDQAPGGWGPGKESSLRAGLGGPLTSGGTEQTIRTQSQAVILTFLPAPLPPQDAQSGPKVIFDAVELLDDTGAGLPIGPLKVPNPINSIRSATRDEFNPNAFSLDVDDPRVDVGGLMAIRVRFHVVGGDYDSVNVVTTSKENRRWDIAERRKLDHNSFIVGVNVYDREAPVNPIYVNVGVSWKASIWDRGKLNDVRYKTVQAQIRLLIGPKDR